MKRGPGPPHQVAKVSAVFSVFSGLSVAMVSVYTTRLAKRYQGRHNPNQAETTFHLPINLSTVIKVSRNRLVQ